MKSRGEHETYPQFSQGLLSFLNTGIYIHAQGLKHICEIDNVVGVKEASFNQELSVETHLLIGQDSIVSTPDEWVLFKGRELGFEQQVMFANTSDWRFDTPGHNYYVQFIDKAMSGDLDEEFYNAHIRPIKQVSDRWWGRMVQKFNGALPAPMCKYWGELMGMRHGHVRPPLTDLSDEEKAERERAGKSPRGTISLRAYHQGGSVVIEVADDGRGLNRDAILAKAREKGILISVSLQSQACVDTRLDLLLLCHRLQLGSRRTGCGAGALADTLRTFAGHDLAHRRLE